MPDSYYEFFPLRPFLLTMSFALGACIGSFLNVCVYRIPRELSVVTPRSFCPACRKQIPWFYNVPILSYIFLRGKCRYCGAGISPRYVLIETLTAVLFLLAALKCGFLPETPILGLVPVADCRLVPVYWLAFSGLLLGTFVDLEHMIIPDRVTLGGIVAGVAASVVLPSLHGTARVLPALLASLAGLGLGWGLMWSVAFFGRLLFRKEAMGFGDVKLLGAIGAFLGWRAVLFTVMVSSLAGSLTGISMVLMGRREMQSRIPYGPFLALAAAVWILWGPRLWTAYLGILSPY